jgi:hypothetical protein
MECALLSGPDPLISCAVLQLYHLLTSSCIIPSHPVPTMRNPSLKAHHSAAQYSTADTNNNTNTSDPSPGLYATIEDAVVMRHLSQEAELTLGMLAFDAFPKFINK